MRSPLTLLACFTLTALCGVAAAEPDDSSAVSATIPDFRVGHVTEVSYASIVVDDYDTAVQWYKSVLGMEKRDDMPYGDGERWVSVAVPEQQFAIVLHVPGLMEGMSEEEIEADKIPENNIILATDDCFAVIEKIKSAGGTVILEPDAQPWGTQAIFQDPWHNQFVIVEAPDTPMEMPE